MDWGDIYKSNFILAFMEVDIWILNSYNRKCPDGVYLLVEKKNGVIIIDKTIDIKIDWENLNNLIYMYT